ncbi:MAG: DUF4624 family lipoprotein [Eubacteriales bacterium]|nr:DUF4624 family lipoprotein [Eubacteriales bacterium]
MKNMVILFVMLLSMAGLTACVSANANAPNTSSENNTTIEMKLDENYDDTDPFINERLFCVSEDLSTLTAEGTFEMDGESGILEVKDNKTKEVLWSNTWEGSVKSEIFSISLENLKKETEYAMSFTGTKISYATIGISFESDLVQEREEPLR